ncbi:MAG TPA: hypothetical protein VMI33_25565 [Streptosporangiaceae bacterium]|nr:hypothetical protein [Streptosporangiaceae bacterium]
MPELPFPPDLDQLRRQARELLRAAAQGESDALARLHAVSDRVVLSAAQLAVAREYGFRSWPALKAAVERDRSIDLGAKPPAPAAVSPDLLEPPEERRSFGGAAAIETAGGVLLPELLVVGPGHAVLHASLVLPAPAAPPPPAVPRQRPLSRKERLAELGRPVWPRVPTFDDVTVTDDRGTTYALKVRETEGRSGQPDEEPEPIRVIFRLEPAPAPEAAWIELRAQDGPTTRLVTSPRAAVHVSDVTPVSAAEKDLEDLARGLIGTRLAGSPVGLRQRSIALARAAAIRESGELDAASELPGQLDRLCAWLTGERPVDDLPPGWSGMLSAANRSDGPARHLDIAAALPPIHGVVLQVDSLVSQPGSWKLSLRARPGWFIHSEDRMQKWNPASVHAEDDLGGGYISSFGGSTGHPGLEELALNFLPPLDPRACRLTLTFRAAGEQVAVAFDLPPNGQA